MRNPRKSRNENSTPNWDNVGSKYRTLYNGVAMFKLGTCVLAMDDTLNLQFALAILQLNIDPFKFKSFYPINLTHTVRGFGSQVGPPTNLYYYFTFYNLIFYLNFKF